MYISGAASPRTQIGPDVVFLASFIYYDLYPRIDRARMNSAPMAWDLGTVYRESLGP